MVLAWAWGGDAYGDQAKLAVQFYQKIVQSAGGNPRTANVELTGHSLGGGLAGFIGALYGKKGTLFDNMAFEDAADNAYTASKQSLYPYQKALRQAIYGNATPWANDLSQLKTEYLTGDFLANSRLGQTTPQSVIDPGSNRRGTTPINPEMHSMAALVIAKFGNENVVKDWKNISSPFWDALFDRNVAKAAYFADAGTSGRYDAEDKMMNAIAYSAIDEGTRIFGDTAIRAF